MTDSPTRLDLPPAPLPDDTRAYFALCAEKLGLIPNVLRAYAFDVSKLNAFTAMYNDLMLAESGLTKLEREMIAVVVSSINRCWYCQVAHGAAVRELSGNPVLGEQMVMNYRAAALTPRQRKMLDFAAHLTEHSHRTEDHHRDVLRAAGFSDRDIWDIAAITGFFNMTNRIASATGMEPNPEYHGKAR
ncbi:putative peroxidase-related enzyme [Rhodovulum imhoffii]|uniref:Putative peroxidase-related enzyme n=1 Tax=Rhodovulum imhoffii TaxID=365340 RepID=A0A2T5BU66_9RHOB|nr:peroxidase-related enzyme [Rhodovulum imhoffii]MBK5934597.1 alkylhydroperoxidase [Rhodovulum imhoffii]PTN02986.1 putative peroxidase-related enzyme [Rhodovulum imhoffii]